MRGLHIKTDGTSTIVEPENGTYYKFIELKKFVEGYIEIVRLYDDWIMIVNEEGAFTKKPNMLATFLAINARAIPTSGIIFGNVLVCKNSEVK